MPTNIQEVSKTDRVKGLMIEIGGNVTGLKKALADVDKSLKNTQTSLKDVNRLLKLDPKNTELLAQKQELLKKAIGETKDRLAALKQAEAQVQQQFKEGKFSEEQYNNLKREIIDTENKLKSLEKEAKQTNSTLAKIGQAGDKLKSVGTKISDTGKKLLPVTAAVAAIGTAAVKTTADFDTSMSKVKAISGATGSDFEKLRDKAREMGSKTKFSASEAADAMSYMAMAGWKTQDMLDGLEGIMNLAAASGEDLATTLDIVTDALTALGLTSKDSAHFADILAAASSNANTNVSMMGETFKYCAPIAGALGFSAEDTAEAIGLMANAGIKSTQAGTTLRTIMNNLAAEIEISGKDAMLHSLSAQVSSYSKLIQGHSDWEYVGVYADEAITGTKAERPNFQRMLDDCRNSLIDMVITKSISRFARNTVTLLETVRELKSLNIDVFFEEQHIHTVSADGELMLTILASYAQEESRSVSENMKWRVKRNFENGLPWNCTIFGYRFDGEQFVVYPKEAEIVKRIFSDYLSGMGTLKKICHDIDFENITVCDYNILIIHLKDGTDKTVQWLDRSRRESRTDEMRKQASERSKRNGKIN